MHPGSLSCLLNRVIIPSCMVQTLHNLSLNTAALPTIRHRSSSALSQPCLANHPSDHGQAMAKNHPKLTGRMHSK